MEGEEERCKELQEDEYTVLESIYPGLVTSIADQAGGSTLTLKIPVVLPQETDTILSTHNGQSTSNSILPAVRMSHLPPLEARIRFSTRYPITSPPVVLGLKSTLPGSAHPESWLSRKSLNSIQERLASYWREERELSGEGSGVIWKWWEWVGTGEFLSDLGLLHGDQLHLSTSPTIAPSTCHTLLKTYNAAQLHSSFEATAFSCSICLENRKGKSCIQMPQCDCVFCAPCLSSCWSLAIEEGTLENVACPSVNCVKKRSLREPGKGTLEAGTELDPNIVEGVVGKELRDRWEKLKKKRKAEIDPTYTICPRPTCQAAVPPPAEPEQVDPSKQPATSSRVIRLADIGKAAPPTPPLTPVAETISHPPDDRWARYRHCPECQYSFCLYCSATWHGPHTPCAFPQTSLIVREYLSYPEGSMERKRMEIRRGKTNLERMVAKWREDEENKKWLESRTRACAGCGVRVEKSHGCNHMTCGRCNAHFCYRCGSSISPQDPYAHYNRPGASCYMKLFDQEEIERFERETAMGPQDPGLENQDVWGGPDNMIIWDPRW